MLYYLVAALLLAHAIFWGAGLAMLSLPGAWKRAWWIWAAPCGWALQSAVVWAGAHGPWAGTNVYALVTELIPAALLAVAWRGGNWRCSVRAAAAAWVIFLVGAVLLLMPLAKRGAWTLTTASLGSCDHADYAAGARVLQEFSREDRVGFLDLPEVTRIGGVERFFDYWLELNHFSPPAIMAHNGAVFGLQPYQLVSISAAVFWLGMAPFGWLLARELGWRPGRRWFAAAALAFSPLGHYAVHHAAMGQMLAAQGIAMLTVVVAGALRRQPAWSAGRAALLALPPFWLIAGSYNFVLAIALAPALAGAGLIAAVRRDPRLVIRVLRPLLLALLVTGFLFAGRFMGIAERFRLLEQYSFGWPVPLLSPEGWAGLVRDAELAAWGGPMRLVGGLLLGAGVALGWWQCWRRSRERAWVAAAWLLTVAGGWAVLAWESRVRANASYDAFKVVTVFLPLVVPVLFLWVGQARGTSARFAGALAAAWIVAIAFPIARIHERMISTTLRVTPPLLAVQRLEEMPRVSSINVLIDDFWSRLWANALLLRKPQYFLTHTYEARRNTELKGAWDLRDGLIQSLPRNSRHGVALNPRFHAVQSDTPGLVSMEFGDGWHPMEQAGNGRWRWSAGSRGEFNLINPGDADRAVRLVLRLRVAGRAKLALRLDGKLVARRPVGGDWVDWEIAEMRVPAGTSRLSVEVESALERGLDRDSRVLGVAIGRGVVSGIE